MESSSLLQIASTVYEKDISLRCGLWLFLRCVFWNTNLKSASWPNRNRTRNLSKCKQNSCVRCTWKMHGYHIREHNLVICIHSRRSSTHSYNIEKQLQTQVRAEEHEEDDILLGAALFTFICFFILWGWQWKKMGVVGRECHLGSHSKLV